MTRTTYGYSRRLKTTPELRGTVAVVVDGPFADCDGEWEFATWSVCCVDSDDGELSTAIYRSREAAMTDAKSLAAQLRVELVIDG